MATDAVLPGHTGSFVPKSTAWRVLTPSGGDGPEPRIFIAGLPPPADHSPLSCGESSWVLSPRAEGESLPNVLTLAELPDDERCCPKCHRPYAEFPSTEDRVTIEIQVRAYRRVIRRKRYRRTCSCPGVPGIITAPAPPRLFPKAIVGISVWVMVLLDNNRTERTGRGPVVGRKDYYGSGPCGAANGRRCVPPSPARRKHPTPREAFFAGPGSLAPTAAPQSRPSRLPIQAFAAWSWAAPRANTPTLPPQ